MRKAKYRPELAQLAQEIVGELSLRVVAYKTGTSYETIRQLVKFGHVPSEEMLEDFAKGMDADLQKLRVAAGYTDKLPEDGVTAVTVALRSVTNLSDVTKQQIIDYVKKLEEEEQGTRRN